MVASEEKVPINRTLKVGAQFAGILKVAEPDEQVADNDIAGSEIDFGNIAATCCKVAFRANPRAANSSDVAQIAECRFVKYVLGRFDQISVETATQPKGPTGHCRFRVWIYRGQRVSHIACIE